jgi:CO/xanthine dehydrogenase Mo-binding subunit
MMAVEPGSSARLPCGMTYEALLEEALRLAPRQRGALAHRLLESVEVERVEVEAANWEAEWTEELRRRMADDDGQRFDLGQTVAELRAGLDRER